MDLPLLAIAAILLAGGAAYATGTAPAAHDVTALDGKVSLRLPAGWVGAEHDGAFEAHLPMLSGLPSSLTIAPVAAEEARAGAAAPREPGEYLMGEAPAEAAEEVTLDAEMARMEERRQRSGVGYRVLQTEEREAFGGHQSSFSHFAMVQDLPGSTPGGAHLPAVVVGVDVLVQTGNGLYQVSASGPPEVMQDDGSAIHELLESVRIR